MRVRIDSDFVPRSITFTTSTGIVVRMPVELVDSSAIHQTIDVPDLASITVVGEIASVTGGDPTEGATA